MRSKTLKTVYALILILIVSGFSAVCADDFYVDAVNGSDAAGDGSQGNPWKRLQFAFDSIEGTEANPHTIFLAPGNYDRPEVFEDGIRADSNEYVTGNSPENTHIYWLRFNTVENINLKNLSFHGIGASEALNIRLYNCIFNCPRYTMAISTANSCVFYVNNCIIRNSHNAFYIHDSQVIIRNTIIVGVNDMLSPGSNSDPEISYSYIEGGWPGTGNITGGSDPGFVNPDAFDFRLKGNSPCIDLGYPGDPVPPGGGSRIDMGCYEYQHKPMFFIESVAFNELTGDHDGVPEYGETIQPTITMCNMGEPAQNLIIDFALDHPDVTMIQSQTAHGDFAFEECRTITGPTFSITDQSRWCLPVVLTGNWTSGTDTGTLEIPFSLHGDTMHVDPVTGNDLSGSGSPETPLKTLGKARDTCQGSRLYPITLFAHAGTFSESSNGESWPFYMDEYEDLEGEGIDTTLCNEQYLDSEFIHGSKTSNLKHFFLENDTEFKWAVEYNSSSYVSILDINTQSGPNGCFINFKGSTKISVSESELLSLDFHDCFPGDNNVVFENILTYGGFSECGAEWYNNQIKDSALFGQYYGLPGNIVYDNVIGGVTDIRNNNLFYDNICHKSIAIQTDTEFDIFNNFIRNGGLVSRESSEPVNVFNTIVVKKNSLGTCYLSDTGAGLNCHNCIALPLTGCFDKSNLYRGYLAGFSLDGCSAMFSYHGIDHPYCSSTMNTISYYNQHDNSSCINTRYSDMVNCPDPTNIDVDPGFVGVSVITDIGDTWFEDNTASWEPDRYAGYYVNPNIYDNDTPYYCTGNTEDTIYVMGSLNHVAEIGDLFVIPDLRLRRVSDGFAYDSSLIDAGDPTETDPDGSRRDIGPFGGPYALTPMPVIPTWPPPDPTATPTPTIPCTPTPTVTPSPTITPTVSPTATPRTTGVTIIMPSDIYQPGDLCWCIASVYIDDATSLHHHPLFVILDVHGTFFFAPSFSEDPDAWTGPWEPGETLITVLNPFLWPVTGTSDTGITWYAALTTPDITEIYGQWDWFEFGWE